LGAKRVEKVCRGFRDFDCHGVPTFIRLYYTAKLAARQSYSQPPRLAIKRLDDRMMLTRRTPTCCA
jgi:hypothetical protein